MHISILSMKQIRLFLAYALMAATFVVLLSSSLDHHFDYAVQERISFGGAGFTASRVLSPFIVMIITRCGLSVRVSALVYVGIATIALLYLFAVLLEKWGGVGREQSLLLAPFILLPMVWNYIILSSIHYVEDVPAILLFTLGLIALAEKKSFRFHAIFLVAVVNRETAVFLIPAMLLMQFGKRKTIPLLAHSFLLLGTALGIRVFLNSLVSSGDPTEVSMFNNHFMENVHFLLSGFKGNTEALRTMMTFSGLWLFLPFCFGKVRREVMLMTVLLPVFFVGMAVVGNLNGEARIYNEMIPVVATPCLLFLTQIIRKGAPKDA